MKIACIADLHIHNFTDFSRMTTVKWNDDLDRFVESEVGYSLNTRLLDTLNAIADMRDYLIENSIKTVIIAGDIFHKRGSVPSEVIYTAYKTLGTFKKKGIDIFAIPGNHDQVSHAEHTFDSISTFEDIMYISSKPGVVDLPEDVMLCMVPYNHSRDLVMDSLNKLAGTQNNSGKKKILVAHLGINGAYVGTSNYAMSDSYGLQDLQPDKYKYVVLGHYHKPQFLGKNAFYTGSPTQNNFNDEGTEHGFMVIDTDKNGYMELVPLNAPKFRTLSTEDLVGYEPSLSEFVRLTVSQNTEIPEELEGCETIRVEFEKSFSKDCRSGLSISQSWADMIKTYAEENNVDSLQVGLDILKSIEEGGN